MTADRRVSGTATGPRKAEAGSIAAAHATKHANLSITEDCIEEPRTMKKPRRKTSSLVESVESDERM